MDSKHRLAQIARMIEASGHVSVTELVARFRVSAVTIRKDLDALEARGHLFRIRGGALAPGAERPERAFDIRERRMTPEKRAIAIAAADSVVDGEIIALDASTTALHLARRLRSRTGWEDLTVLTNSLRIATELAGPKGIHVAVPGGWVRAEALSIIGSLAKVLGNRSRVDRAFVGAAGLLVDGGLYEATEAEARVKRAMVASATKVVVMIDRSKWGRPAAHRFCETGDVDLVLTDAGAPPESVARLRELGTAVLVVHAADEEAGLRD
jgi:DeoR/GlpR family transcriptional regulator of sugar metabolism